MAITPYTLEQAEEEIAALRNQLDLLGEAHTQVDPTFVPIQPAAGQHTRYDTAGHMKYISGGDGNIYHAGWASARTTTDQTINFTSDQVITGTVALSLSVEANVEYRVHGLITWTQGAGSVTQAMGLTGPTTSHVRIPNAHWLTGSGPGANVGAPSPNVYSTLAGGTTTPAFANTSVCWWEFDGWVVFTAQGTFSAVAHCNGANTFSVNSYSFIEISPRT